MDVTRPKRPGEDVFGLAALAVSIALFWQSYEIAGFSALSSPGAFPMAASGAMALSSLIVVWGNIRRSRAGGVAADREPILTATALIFTALVLGYALLLAPLGFLLSSFLFLFAGMRLLYRGKWLTTLGIVLLTLTLIYIVFRLVFQVVLPEGIVPERQIIAAIGNFFGGSR